MINRPGEETAGAKEIHNPIPSSYSSVSLSPHVLPSETTVQLLHLGLSSAPALMKPAINLLVDIICLQIAVLSRVCCDLGAKEFHQLMLNPSDSHGVQRCALERLNPVQPSEASGTPKWAHLKSTF